MAGYTERLENRGLNAFVIRMIAWVGMIWGSVQPLMPPMGVDWATYMLLFSYTLFAFLLTKGFAKTTDKKLYLRRLAVFTIISEPCYDLYFSGTFWDPSRQSIMINLLIGFLVLLITDYVRQKFDNMILTFLCLAVLVLCATTGTVFLNADEGRYGILIIGVFYICGHVTYTRILELICFLVFIVNAAAANYLNILVNDLYYSVSDKFFVLLAAIVTWFYNGKRGPNSLVMKRIYYAFFPAMLLILFAIKSAIN